MPTVREIMEQHGFDPDDEFDDIVLLFGDGTQMRSITDTRDPDIARAMLAEATESHKPEH